MNVTNMMAKAWRRVNCLSNGSETPDPESLTETLTIKRPETIQEQIRRMIRSEASLEAQKAGFETFEDAEDFEVGDDFDPSTPYEMDFDHEMAATENPDSGDSDNFVQETPATNTGDSSADSNNTTPPLPNNAGEGEI